MFISFLKDLPFNINVIDYHLLFYKKIKKYKKHAFINYTIPATAHTQFSPPPTAPGGSSPTVTATDFFLLGKTSGYKI